MNNFDFFILFHDGFWVFVPILIICLLIFNRIGKKISSSWLSPVKFNVLKMGIGTTVAIFLFFLNQISIFQISYVLLSTILFFFVFCRIFKNNQIPINYYFKYEKYYENRLFYLIYSLYTLITLFSYVRFGIPLFNEYSRLATYVDSGGFGLIERFQKFMYIYIIFYLIATFLDHRRSKESLFIWIFPMITFGILSGSRSSFLQIVFIFWAVKTFFKGEQPKLSSYKSLIIPFLTISLITFFIEKGSVTSALLGFFERVVATGDVYWIGLGNDNWDKIEINEPIKYVLNGFLTPLRLLNNYNETPIGYQLNSMLVGFEVMKGPVASFPVSSYILFGPIGGLIYTAIQATICGIMMKFTYIRSNSILICSFSYFVFTNALPFFADGASATGGLANIVFNLGLFIFFLFFLSYLKIARNVKCIG